MTTKSHNNRGFSLLELLAVLVLMAGVAATVLPQFNKTGGAEVQSTARTLAAGLRRARSQAIQHLRPQSLSLDVERREFKLSFESHPRKLSPNIGLKLFTARSELEDPTRGAIRFFSDGGSTGGRITVSGASRELLVNVEWLTGRVSILDAEGKTMKSTGGVSGVGARRTASQSKQDPLSLGT